MRLLPMNALLPLLLPLQLYPFVAHFSNTNVLATTLLHLGKSTLGEKESADLVKRLHVGQVLSSVVEIFESSSSAETTGK